MPNAADPVRQAGWTIDLVKARLAAGEDVIDIGQFADVPHVKRWLSREARAGRLQAITSHVFPIPKRAWRDAAAFERACAAAAEAGFIAWTHALTGRGFVAGAAS